MRYEEIFRNTIGIVGISPVESRLFNILQQHPSDYDDEMTAQRINDLFDDISQDIKLMSSTYTKKFIIGVSAPF